MEGLKRNRRQPIVFALASSIFQNFAYGFMQTGGSGKPAIA
jgi:hypothetical protein